MMFSRFLLNRSSPRQFVRLQSSLTPFIRRSPMMAKPNHRWLTPVSVCGPASNNAFMHSLIPAPLLLPSSYNNNKRTHSDPFAPLPLPSASFHMQTMNFASSSEDKRRQRQERRARRLGVKERERESVTGEPVNESSQAPTRSQADAMTDGQSAYIRSVWGLVGANLGVCSIGTMVSMVALPGLSPIIPGIASLGFLLGLSFGAPKGSNPVLRASLLGAFAFTTGMTLGPIVGMAMNMDPLLVPMALGASTGIFAGATAFSFFAPEGRLLALGGPLMGGVFTLIGCQVVNMIWGPYPVLTDISLYGGLGIFTLFVAYDTQQILDDYKNGVRDTVQHSIGLFIDFVAIFRRMLMLFMMRGDD